MFLLIFCFFFQAEDGIRDLYVTGVQTCALPIYGFVFGTEWGSVKGTTEIPSIQFAQNNLFRMLFKPGKDYRFYDRSYSRSEERRVGKECRYRWSRLD